MSDHTFCRIHLKFVMEEVRKHTTPAERKQAWAWMPRSLSDDTCEFHAHDGFYFHDSACCLWNARALGWQAWLAHKGLDESEAA